MAFGKKVQVCGVMAGPRLDEVKDNCFRLPSRLNSTWGGNFTDMVRSKHYLQIIEEENLVENAARRRRAHRAGAAGDRERMPDDQRGARPRLVHRLRSAGRRDARRVLEGSLRSGLLVLKSGERAIRFRPALDLTAEVADEAMDLLRAAVPQDVASVDAGSSSSSSASPRKTPAPSMANGAAAARSSRSIRRSTAAARARADRVGRRLRARGHARAGSIREVAHDARRRCAARRCGSSATRCAKRSPISASSSRWRWARSSPKAKARCRR